MSDCKEFVFTWTIGNYFFCNTKCGEYYCSPNIFTNTCYETVWYLRLYPRGDDDPEFVCVELVSEEDCEKPVVENFKIELFNSKEEVFAKAEKKKLEMSDLGTYSLENIIRIDKLEKEMEKSAEDSLIVRCRMFMQENLNPSERSCSAVTEIGLNTLSLPWEVILHLFSEFPNRIETKICSINEDTQLNINLRAHLDDFLFEIKLVSKTKTLLVPVRCKIVLLKGIDMELLSSCAFFTFKERSSIWHFPQFLKISLLDEKILLPGFLRLRLNFKCSNGLTNSKYNDNTDLKNLPVFCSLKYDLSSMLLNKEHTDVSLRIESEIISAHKCILASRSPVFSAMFNQEMVENQSGVIDISDMDVQTLRLFLEFLYTEEIIDLNWERALDLLLIAEKYQVFSLKEKCCKFLKSNLNADNICDVVSVADMVRHQILKTAAINYIKENSTEVLGSPKWLEWIKKNGKLCSELFYALSQEFKTIQNKV